MILRPEYEELGIACINKYEELEGLKEHPCSIAYLGSDKQKSSRGMITYADCTKIPDKYKWMGEYDFMITVYERNCEGLTDEQMEILMLHELMHIKVDENGDGTATYSIRDHDVQDFNAILERFGLGWNRKPTDIPGQMAFTMEGEK